MKHDLNAELKQTDKEKHNHIDSSCPVQFFPLGSYKVKFLARKYLLYIHMCPCYMLKSHIFSYRTFPSNSVQFFLAGSIDQKLDFWWVNIGSISN